MTPPAMRPPTRGRPRAQATGHCQACGAAYGVFERAGLEQVTIGPHNTGGVPCPGSNQPPLEHSRALTDRLISGWRARGAAGAQWVKILEARATSWHGHALLQRNAVRSNRDLKLMDELMLNGIRWRIVESKQIRAGEARMYHLQRIDKPSAMRWITASLAGRALAKTRAYDQKISAQIAEHHRDVQSLETVARIAEIPSPPTIIPDTLPTLSTPSGAPVNVVDMPPFVPLKPDF